MTDAERCATRVWPLVSEKHPLFTRAHDSFDDPWAVETLVLGEAIGFQSFDGAQVMDIGANVGIWTALCAVEGASVTAYEADPVTFGVLSEMLRRTNLHKVTAVNQAIWSEPGEIPFHGEYKGTGALIRNGQVIVAGKNIKSVPAEIPRVPCITLEEAIGDKMWDCLKFDVEGAEFDILMSVPLEILRTNVRYMAVELHHEWESNRQKYDALIERMSSVFMISGCKAAPGDPWEGRYHWMQLRAIR